MLPVWFVFKVCCQLLIWVRFDKSTSCSTALLGVPAWCLWPACSCVACMRPPAALMLPPFLAQLKNSIFVLALQQIRVAVLWLLPAWLHSAL